MWAMLALCALPVLLFIVAGRLTKDAALYIGVGLVVYLVGHAVMSRGEKRETREGTHMRTDEKPRP